VTVPPAAKPDGKAARTDEDAESAAPSLGRNRPIALLLQAGAIAGAIASISGIVFGVVHAVNRGHSGGRPAAPQPGQVHLAVPRSGVHRLTYAQYLKANGFDTKYAPPDQVDDVGVTVDYELSAPGYARGAEIPVLFRVFRIQPGGYASFVDELRDTAKLEVDSDSCTCTSTFIQIPRQKALYHIEVQVFRPGRKTHSPLKTDVSEPFRGFG
jgi:hypothetical protein